MKIINIVLSLAVILAVSACAHKKSCDQPKDCKSVCIPVCR